MSAFGSVDAVRARLRADLVVAMKAREGEAVSALRTALAAIDNAEAVDVRAEAQVPPSGPIAGAQAGAGSTEMERRMLSVGEVRALLEAEIADRIEAAERYEAGGHHDRADRLRREVDVLSKYVEG
jgi:uncharacterized protein YqeY